MLLGADGPGAAERVAVGLARVRARGGEELEVIDRAPLVLAVGSGETQSLAVEDGLLCLLDGEVTAAPWRAVSAPAERPFTPAELLHAWQRDGEQILTGMRGRFVLALWDESRRTGLLVRDPTGVQPLFRAQSGRTLVFASEITQLLPCLPQTPAPDPVALAFVLSNDACWADRTLLEGVVPLRTGRLLSLGDGRARERTWWAPRYVPPPEVGLREAEAAVRSAITRSIASRLRPGAGVGVRLSGGLDSSAVAALAAQIPGVSHQLTAYSAVFPDHPETDEREGIAAVCGEIGIPGGCLTVRGGSPLAGVLRFIDRWGVLPPSANCHFWPTLVDRAHEDGVRLLLGGEGGDELFGFSPPLLADRLRGGRLRATLELARRLPGGDRQSMAVLVRCCLREAAISAIPSDWLRRARRPSSAWLAEPEWLAPHVAALHSAAADPLAWKALDGPRWWAYNAHLLTTGREVAGVSDGIRRLYERSGLCVHDPLLDPDVVELVLGLPPELAFDPRFDRPLLRGAVAGLLPEQVRTRAGKSNFASVLIAGVAEHDLPLARELLLSPHARVRDLIRPEAVRRGLLECQPQLHPAGPAGWAIDIWHLLAVECWLRALDDPDATISLLERMASRTSFHLEFEAAAP